MSDYPDEELLAASIVPGNSEFDAGLRPKSLADFIGQPKVCEQLELVLHAARQRGAHPTTSCCPVRPGSARPRWP